jgi:hypothetical protein
VSIRLHWSGKSSIVVVGWSPVPVERNTEARGVRDVGRYTSL